MESTIIIKVYPNKETHHILNKYLTFTDIKASVNSVKRTLQNDDSKYLIFITLHNSIIRYYVYNPVFEDLYLYVNLIEIPEKEVRDIIYKYLLDFEHLDYSPDIKQQQIQIQQLIDEGVIEEKSVLKEIAESSYNWIKNLLKRNKVKSVKEYNKIFGDFSFIEFLSKMFNLYGLDLNKEYEKFFYVYDMVNYNTDKLDYKNFEKKTNSNDFEFYFSLNEHRGQPDPQKVKERQEAHQRALEAQKERQERQKEEAKQYQQVQQQTIQQVPQQNQSIQQQRQNRTQQEIEQIKQQSIANAERKYNEANQKLKESKEKFEKDIPNGKDISDLGSAKADALSTEIKNDENLRTQLLTNKDARDEKEKEMTEEVEKEMLTKFDESSKDNKDVLSKGKEFYHKYIKEHAVDIVAVALIVACII